MRHVKSFHLLQSEFKNKKNNFYVKKNVPVRTRRAKNTGTFSYGYVFCVPVKCTGLYIYIYSYIIYIILASVNCEQNVRSLLQKFSTRIRGRHFSEEGGGRPIRGGLLKKGAGPPVPTVGVIEHDCTFVTLER